MKAEVVAQVNTTYRFTGMADYQYVSSDPRLPSQRYPWTPANEPCGVDPEPLLTVPPLFSKLDMPEDYAFRSQSLKKIDPYKLGTQLASPGRCPEPSLLCVHLKSIIENLT